MPRLRRQMSAKQKPLSQAREQQSAPVVQAPSVGTRSLCITEDGGRCFLRCGSNADCREGYECDTEPTPTGTDVQVCSRINP